MQRHKTGRLRALAITFFLLMLTLPPAIAKPDGKAPPEEPVVVPTQAEMMAKIEALSRKVDELSRLVEMLMLRKEQGSPTAVPAAALDTANQGQTGSPNAEMNKPAEKGLREPGLLRFSGDFRLRLDGIFRPPFNPASEDQQPLPHVQNVRGRYRLRLNFDSDIRPSISFHGQFSTGPVNNHLTEDQDFAAIVTRPPIQLSEAWVDFHPVRWGTFQGGRVQEVFSDYNLSYLFDDDLAFNGFNQRVSRISSRKPAGLRSVEFRAGQYIFTNPNVAIVTPGNLGPTGAVTGSTGRAAQMFHQGFLVEQEIHPKAFHVLGGDIQIYRNSNQIQFASTAAGYPLLVQNPLGVALAGPIPGAGTATTTPGGPMYTARNFHIARLFYRLDYSGMKYPLSFHVQLSRNVGTGAAQRDGLLAYAKIGRVQKARDFSFAYLFTIKGANSMISQLTDDNLGTLTGVNIRTHFLRFDLGLSKKIQWQSLLFIQNELSNSGQYPNFYVPVNGYTPRLYRLQEQIVFGF